MHNDFPLTLYTIIIWYEKSHHKINLYKTTTFIDVTFDYPRDRSPVKEKEKVIKVKCNQDMSSSIIITNPIILHIGVWCKMCELIIVAEVNHVNLTNWRMEHTNTKLGKEMEMTHILWIFCTGPYTYYNWECYMHVRW